MGDQARSCNGGLRTPWTDNCLRWLRRDFPVPGRRRGSFSFSVRRAYCVGPAWFNFSGSWGATCALALSALAISGLPLLPTVLFSSTDRSATLGGAPLHHLAAWVGGSSTHHPGSQVKNLEGRWSEEALCRPFPASHRVTERVPCSSTVQYPYCKGIGWRVYRI